MIQTHFLIELLSFFFSKKNTSQEIWRQLRICMLQRCSHFPFPFALGEYETAMPALLFSTNKVKKCRPVDFPASPLSLYYFQNASYGWLKGSSSIIRAWKMKAEAMCHRSRAPKSSRAHRFVSSTVWLWHRFQHISTFQCRDHCFAPFFRKQVIW